MQNYSPIKFDSHAHITSDAMYEDIEDVLYRAKEANTSKIVNINTDRKTLERGLELAEKYPKLVYNAVATTPHDVLALGESDFPYFSEYIKKKKVIAIGETGLDYFYEHSDRNCQLNFLRKYLELAEETGLPVIFHCRGDEAFSDLFVEAESRSAFPAVLHCFTGTKEQAEKVLEMGWYVSISGIATFKKSKDLREVLEHIPLERLLIETDSPYLAPEGYRGKRNEPSLVGKVAETVAEVKGLTEEEICMQTYKNACAFFQILSTVVRDDLT